MTAAFKTALPSTQKFVLVALSDSANDQGECYPSVQVVMDKCSLSERAVQGAIATLEADGHVHREFRKGRSTVYWIHPKLSTAPAAGAPRTTCTPQQVHPTPAPSAPPPPHDVHPTPAAGAPITIIEPSVEPSGKRKRKSATTSVAVSVLVDAGFDEATAEEFLACKAERKAPLTERAWKDHIREAGKAGWSVVEAAEKVMAKTWKGFEAKYVANEMPIGRGGAPPIVSRQAALEARNRAVIDEYRREREANEHH